MAPRSLWNGSIAFGLVTVPVKVYTATDSRSVHFREVHAKDGGKIEHRRICPKEGKAVGSDEIVRGYQLHAALGKADRAGVGRWVFHNRERTVIVRPLGDVLALHTMRFADEVVDPSDLELARVPARGEPERLMPRSLWTGSLSFGLVNVPVAMFSGVSDRDLHAASSTPRARRSSSPTRRTTSPRRSRT